MASLRLICFLVLAGCYDIPRPDCGFQCGPATNGEAACPSGYTCVDDRCRLDTERELECPAIMDPPMVTDTTPPTVMARAPAPDEVGVELDAIVLVTFDEEVAGVDATTFGLSTDTGFVMGDVTVASPGRAFRFTPDRPLLVNKVYEVVLGTAITDLSQNALAETRWTFSTIEDHTGPMIVASTPVDGATNVPTIGGQSVSFDEPVMGVDMASVRLEQNGTVIPTTLSMPFANVVALASDPLVGETTYTIVLTDQITDLQGNPFTPAAITFTTRDATPPAILDRVPAPDATGVALDTTVAITFSESLADQDLSLSSSGDVVDVAFTDEFHPDGSYTIRLAPMAVLAADTVYTVHIGMVRDDFNNAATFPDYTFKTAP